jgi:hypothetical protein
VRWWLFLLLAGCEVPNTAVVFENDLPSTVYAAFWQVAVDTPIAPGSASPPAGVVSASANTAYAVLAPGWDPSSSELPKTLIALESVDGFAVPLGDTLDIPVDGTAFAGNCAAGSTLPQTEADFITQRVFATDFIGLIYDAATCTTTGGP